jgi:hypothetical protein
VRGRGHLAGPVPDRGQPQHPAGLVDCGVGGLLGQAAARPSHEEMGAAEPATLALNPPFSWAPSTPGWQ